MATKIDYAKIARQNPAVNVRQLRELVGVLKTLRDNGFEGASYNIVPAFTRQPRADEPPKRQLRIRRK
jgi:hypothetical protein